MAGHAAFDFGFEAGHSGASGLQVSDLFAGLFVRLEIDGDGTAGQNGDVVTHDHGVDHLIGDETPRQARAALPRSRCAGRGSPA